MGTILLVCTGNICRSPMASGFLTGLLRDQGVGGVMVESCGVSAWEGSPATPEAVEAMRERGLDISGHVARRMNRRIIEAADLIVGMASEHREAVRRIARPAASRTFTLKELVHLLDSAGPPQREASSEDLLRSSVVRADAVRDAYPDLHLQDEDVADPLGLGLESFRAVAWEIGVHCQGVVDMVFVPGNDVPTREGEREEPGAESRSDQERRDAMRDFAADWGALRATDPDVAEAIANELRRERTSLRLIASENYASPAVLAALASTMNNKYAEGYPGRRYYGGCEYVDVAENLAIERAKQLFGADHVNVQPHSGAQANMAVYFTLLKPGDTVLGMNLAHGGHLTHGHPLNFSGKLYTIVPYGVRRDNERIDYEELERLAHEHKPKMIMVGASAYPRVIDFARIGAVGKAIGTPVVTDMAHIAGLVAANVHPSPVPHSDFVTTTTHKTLRGPRGGMVLCRSQYAKDLDRIVFPGIQGGPLMHIIAAKAVCFKEAMEPTFVDYQKQIVANAKRLAAALSAEGFRLVSGGT